MCRSTFKVRGLSRLASLIVWGVVRQSKVSSALKRGKFTAHSAVQVILEIGSEIHLMHCPLFLNCGKLSLYHNFHKRGSFASRHDYHVYVYNKKCRSTGTESSPAITHLNRVPSLAITHLIGASISKYRTLLCKPRNQ